MESILVNATLSFRYFQHVNFNLRLRPMHAVTKLLITHMISFGQPNKWITQIDHLMFNITKEHKTITICKLETLYYLNLPFFKNLDIRLGSKWREVGSCWILRRKLIYPKDCVLLKDLLRSYELWSSIKHAWSFFLSYWLRRPGWS